MPFHVLFLCTGNSARSILSEATLNHYGVPRFAAYSGGSKPAGGVNPHALRQLESAGISTDGLYSKNFDLFAREDAPAFDAVITLCDSAQLDPCPVFLGDFVRSHWGLPDPVLFAGNPAQVAAEFAQTHSVIAARIRDLVALPVETMSREDLARALARIADAYPAPAPRVPA